jgi:hypothetical protein
MVGRRAADDAGDTVIDPELHAGVFDQIRRRGTDEDRPILTARKKRS